MIKSSELNNALKPAVLTEEKESYNLKDQNGAVYKLKEKLQGRGQDGLANFYQAEGSSELLIKEDTPGTCLLEGTARFVKEGKYLPKGLEGSVNYCSLGVLNRDKKTSIVSIQDRVVNKADGSVEPWDKIVFGHKRNPKTIISEEFWNSIAIDNHLDSLSLDVQWQLASGIFSSVLAGDESLHIGQFMAILDDKRNITGIKRIDLGARERFASERVKSNDIDPFKTSNLYSSSGQFGKDYIGYLLTHPSIKDKYTMLWANLKRNHMKDDELKESLLHNSELVFAEELKKIPDELKKVAIRETEHTINRKSKKKGYEYKYDFSIEEDDDFSIIDQLESGSGDGSVDDRGLQLAREIARLDEKRIVSMCNLANKQFNGKILGLQSESEDDVQKKTCEIIVQTFESNHKEINQLATELEKQLELLDKHYSELIYKYLEERINGNKANEINSLLKQITISADLMTMLTNTLSIHVYDGNLEKINLAKLNSMQQKSQSLLDLVNYSTRDLSQNKLNAINQLVKACLTEESKTINTALMDCGTILAEHSNMSGNIQSSLVGKKTEGVKLIDKLAIRYKVDLSQFLFEAVLKNDEEEVLKIINTSNDKKSLLESRHENQTVMYLASTLGFSKIVSCLLGAGADIDNSGPPHVESDENIGYESSFVAAAKNNNKEVVDAILDSRGTLSSGMKRKKADSTTGKTALHYAAENRNIDMVINILKSTGKLESYSKLADVLDNNAESPLHLLVRHANVQDLERIEGELSAGAWSTYKIQDIFSGTYNKINSNGKSPIDLAILSGKNESALWLAKRIGVDLEKVKEDIKKNESNVLMSGLEKHGKIPKQELNFTGFKLSSTSVDYTKKPSEETSPTKPTIKNK